MADVKRRSKKQIESAWRRLRDEFEREDKMEFNAWKNASAIGFLVGNYPVFIKPKFWK